MVGILDGRARTGKLPTNHILIISLTQSSCYITSHYINMAHAPPLNIYAVGAMSSVLVIYAWLKSPIKYKWAAENRISPKADLAWRNSAQKWLDNN